jgi:hypothetical protein
MKQSVLLTAVVIVMAGRVTSGATQQNMELSAPFTAD